MSRTFPFTILRAVTAAPRGESLNVGIIAWPVNGKPVMRFDFNRSRLRALHPNFGRFEYDGWTDALGAQLAQIESTEAQRAFLPMLAAPFQVDRMCGTMSAAEGEEQAAITAIFERVVLLPCASVKAAPAAKRATRLEAEIRAWLRKAKLYSPRVDDLSRRRVVSHFPIDPASDLYTDFALKNGAIHVIETLDLRGVTSLSAGNRGEAAVKGITLDEAREKIEGGGKRIAVIQASDYSVARPAINLLNRYADELWDMNVTADRQAFAGFIAKSLHVDDLAGL